MSVGIEKLDAQNIEDAAYAMGISLARLLGNGYKCELHPRTEYEDPNTYYTLADVKSPNSRITFAAQVEQGLKIRLVPFVSGHGLVASVGIENVFAADFSVGHSFGDKRAYDMRVYKSPQGTYAVGVTDITGKEIEAIQEKDTKRKNICFVRDIKGNDIMICPRFNNSGDNYVRFTRNGMNSTQSFSGCAITNDTFNTKTTELVRAMDLWNGDYLSDLYVLRNGAKGTSTFTIGGKSYLKIFWVDNASTTARGLAFQVN